MQKKVQNITELGMETLKRIEKESMRIQLLVWVGSTASCLFLYYGILREDAEGSITAEIPEQFRRSQEISGFMPRFLV